ncbi:hypothetical protein pEaSNUABM22_00255 [Erwinia phage pEa_SNUABM_22]|uniref:Uncharacterized protein n=1 Tax=Erwinia phage pEa_SNUABM_22 TaxID=2869549 RepID=A0AAE8XRV2_9CAUD|nr:hypothetical protein MPK63_gp254 [Erwinia phage pEa_SNUABM_22]UAW96742.1 hypothetical protein pEaSNUABM22_00255 [Erwinia phage pEa_SNUABM_22]
MKAANFDVAFNAKDEATLNAYAAQITEALNALGRHDLKINIIFGTDPFGERPDFVNDPNGFRVTQNGEEIFDIYTPTEKQVEGDASDAFIYASWADGEAPWGKDVSDNDIAEIAEHLNAAIPRVGRVFNESDRQMLQKLADTLNARMDRTDARVIVTNGAEDDLIVMVVGYDEEEDEVSDEYGFFLSLPYTDEDGTDEKYSLHYAGYPDVNDHSYSSADLDEISEEIEALDLL